MSDDATPAKVRLTAELGPGAEALTLVERLRQQWPDTPHHRDALHREAADEIERLRAELERLQHLLKSPTRGTVFAGWFLELRSGMTYRLWQQGGHDPEPGEVPLYV